MNLDVSLISFPEHNPNCWLFCNNITVDDGKKLEKELNDNGPGEAYYIKCDVTIEEDIKVTKHITSRFELGSLSLICFKVGQISPRSLRLSLRLSLPRLHDCAHV